MQLNYLTANQAIVTLDPVQDYVRNLLRQKILVVFQNGSWRIPVESIEDYVEGISKND